MLSENESELTGNELALNDDSLNAIRSYFNNVLDTTQQWIDYAQANASDPAVAQEAALVVRQNIEDMKGQIALTTNLLDHAVRLIGGQAAAIEELTDQRDEAVTETNTLRAEMSEQKALAHSAGFDEAKSLYELDPDQMDEILDEEITEREADLDETIHGVAADLRHIGEIHDADQLEAAHGLSLEMRQRTEELLVRAQQVVFVHLLDEQLGEDDSEDEDAEDDAA